MSKKKFLLIFIPVFIVALILFLPIPAGVMNDGGSRDYRALTYRLVRWNRILPSEDGNVDYFTKWCFYPLPLCCESIDTLWAAEAEKHPELQSPSRETFVEENPTFKDSYIRVDGSGGNALVFSRLSESGSDADGWNRLPILTLKTKEELHQILSSLKSTDAYQSGLLWNQSDLFTLDGTYDETFFEEKNLLLIYIAESSSSNTHRIHDLVVNDGVCTVVVETLAPEAGDCAMAGWLICLEVKKDFVANKTFDAYRFRK